MKSCLVAKEGMRWGSMMTLQPPSLAFTCSTAKGVRRQPDKWQHCRCLGGVVTLMGV